MRAHIKEHSKKQCERCTKTFKYEEIKKKHMQITHENAKIFCNFFNNEKICPYDEECVFLHLDSSLCKYGKLCERKNCMFKHEIDKGILTVSVIDVVEKSNETESNEESNVESDETEIIVDVHQKDVECEVAIFIVEPAEEIVVSEIALQ